MSLLSFLSFSRTFSKCGSLSCCCCCCCCLLLLPFAGAAAGFAGAGCLLAACWCLLLCWCWLPACWCWLLCCCYCCLCCCYCCLLRLAGLLLSLRCWLPALLLVVACCPSWGASGAGLRVLCCCYCCCYPPVVADQRFVHQPFLKLHSLLGKTNALKNDRGHPNLSVQTPRTSSFG